MSQNYTATDPVDGRLIRSRDMLPTVNTVITAGFGILSQMRHAAVQVLGKGDEMPSVVSLRQSSSRICEPFWRFAGLVCCFFATFSPVHGLAGGQPGQSPIETVETWDAIYLQAAKMGYGRTRISGREEDGRQLRQIDALMRMSVKRLGQKLDIEMSMRSIETIEGQVVRFRSEVALGPTPTVVTGEFRDGAMHLTTKTLGKSVTSKLPWKSNYRGFFYDEQTLNANPMKPGDRRSYVGLVPVFNQLAPTQMVAGEYEETELLDGKKRRLLKITTITQFGGAKIKAYRWTDVKGHTLKTLEPTMNQVSYRTTREFALRNGSFAPDLLVGSIVKPSGGTGELGSAKSVTYRVTISGRDVVELFPSGLSQSVRAISKNVAELSVQRIRAGGKQVSTKNNREPAPTKQDRDPSNWIQSDDPAVVKLAGEVAKDEKDTAIIAVALERHVNQLITEKDFSTALATAAEVAKSRQGDCTEHAVLLAALARARGIPSRVAVGLVYVRPLGGFGYHMWTEMWLDGGWFPLDATRPQGGTGCGHIKIAHDNLGGTGGSLVFLPVLRVLGKLKIEVGDITKSP